jgi:hypothetical protein
MSRSILNTTSQKSHCPSTFLLLLQLASKMDGYTALYTTLLVVGKKFVNRLNLANRFA